MEEVRAMGPPPTITMGMVEGTAMIQMGEKKFKGRLLLRDVEIGPPSRTETKGAL